ncbi:DUF4342 domain-containing protein [Actinokineospora fastidiosa]|uniref:DUF4342 domain-containing protein n=1 Tax=Actinokineospora fastidiosa TaxID=1816 RepID=A0A918GBJ0_9PSEU|nr:DUF4342 domain-containing protein [Actinokineospora fastidiosa]GGS28690.1 hypothetical protein GCM10010171_22260 [Actinokineospora fastidiosa]
MTSRAPTRAESARVDGRQVADRIKTLVREGNSRHLVVKDKSGKRVIEMPVTAGVVAAVVAPVVSAVGALAALANRWTIAVEPTGRDAAIQGTAEPDAAKDV